MSELENYTVTIKRGMINLETSRNELISCVETPDGLTFRFKHGINFVVEDQNMSSVVKQKVCVADVNFKKGNIFFNLNDYANPVSLKL